MKRIRTFEYLTPEKIAEIKSTYKKNKTALRKRYAILTTALNCGVCEMSVYKALSRR